MMEWLLLALQTVAAIISLEVLRTRIAPSIGAIAHPAILLDVWGPIALVIPLLALVRPTVTGDSPPWIVVGGPVCALAIGLGLAMIVQGRSFAARGPNMEHAQGSISAPVVHIRDSLIWLGVGVLLVLVACAHELSVWTGQCIFALAAVLLWINTPDTRDEAARDAPKDNSVHERRAWNGLTWFLVLAIVQGACTGMVHRLVAGTGPASLVSLASEAMSMLHIVAALALLARCAGPAFVMRWSGWAGAFGVLLAIGLVSVVQLVPTAWQIFQGETPRLGTAMARGMSAFIADGVLLVGAGGLSAAAPWMWPRGRRLLGPTILLGVLAWVAMRLA